MDFSNLFLSFSSLYKIISSLFCSIFLLYQIIELFSQFLSGKTVVNIELKREIYENLPAITLCLPQIVSLEALAKYNPDYQRDYNISNEMLSQKYLMNTTLYNEIKPNLTKIYRGLFMSLFKFISNEDFFQIVIDNLSLPYDVEVLSVEVRGKLQGKY